MDQAQFAAGLAQFDASTSDQIGRHFRGVLLDFSGRPTDALALYRKLWPELFQPGNDAYRIRPWDSVLVANALIHSGDRSTGELLLRRGLGDWKDTPHGGGAFALGWAEVEARALLGQLPQACSAMQGALAHGYFQSLARLQVHPDLDALRASACFAPLMAEALRRSDAQIASARNAGLLPRG